MNRQPIFTIRKDYVRAGNLLKFYNYVDYPVRFSKFLLLSLDQRKEIWQRLNGSKTFVDILAYCFMPNHFHLLLKQNEEKGISRLLKHFQIGYSKYFNTKNERVGPLLQGQFKAVKIETEEQLLHVSRYIHLNPFSSAVVSTPDNLINYEWSSLREYLENQPLGFCNKKIISSYFKKSVKYREFILDQANYQKELESIKHLVLD